MRVFVRNCAIFSFGLGLFGPLLAGCGGGGGGAPKVTKQFTEVRDSVYDLYPSLLGDLVSTVTAGGRSLGPMPLQRPTLGQQHGDKVLARMLLLPWQMKV